MSVDTIDHLRRATADIQSLREERGDMEAALNAARAEAEQLRERVRVLEEALRACRYELRNYERTEFGTPNTSALNAIEEADAALNPKAEEVGPTHRCKVCGALWRLNPAMTPKRHRLLHCDKDDCPMLKESWSVVTPECMGKCCDNVAMGDQIEPLNPKAEEVG